MNRLLVIRPISFLIVVIVMNAAFGNSFMQIKLGPVTLNEFLLLFVFLYYSKHILFSITKKLPLQALFIWITYSFVLVLIGLLSYGPIALRDATHQVDILTFFIVISVGYKFLNEKIILKMISISLALEFIDRIFLAGLFRSFTPFSGQPFFGGSIGSNLIIISAFWIGVSVKNIPNYFRYFLVIISCSLILLMQNRYMYISLVITTLLYLLFYNQEIKAKLRFLLIASVGLIIIEPVFMFITFIGGDLGAISKYGAGLSAAGIYEHLKTALGYSSEVYNGAADGFEIRFLWWGEILNKAISNIEIMFGGQGFGMPLTRGTHLKPVREPHNSLISIFARGGIIYLLVWLSALISSLRSAFKHCYTRIDVALFFGLLSTLIMSLVEPAFELPPVCIIFYFFLGYLLSKRNVFTANT